MPNVAANKVSRDAVMTTHSRETKVLVVLAASITLGAIILNALGHNPPSAGAFCLSRYYRLGPVEESIFSRAAQWPARWNRLEIHVSVPESGKIEQLASLREMFGPEHINCHFIICNGRIGHDGQIQPTEKWQKQSSVIPEGWDCRSVLPSAPSERSKYKTPTHSSEQTIYICVIADGKTGRPTDFQIKRTEALVEGLSKKFNIQPESMRYPDDWR